MYPIQNYRIRFAAVTAIPIGLSVLFVIGGWMYREGRRGGWDEDQDVQGIDEESE